MLIQAEIIVNAPILLLGPSAIGKTTAIKYAMKRIKHVHFVVLDNIVHKKAREAGLIDKKENLNALIDALDRDRDRLFEYGMQALDEFMLTHQEWPVVVDVGTGFLDGSHSLEWVISKPSLAITAEPSVAYDRFRKARKLDVSYEQYSTTQFSKKRLACYNSAALVVKSDGLDQEVLCERFLFSLLSLLDKHDRDIVISDYVKKKNG